MAQYPSCCALGKCLVASSLSACPACADLFFSDSLGKTRTQKRRHGLKTSRGSAGAVRAPSDRAAVPATPGSGGNGPDQSRDLSKQQRMLNKRIAQLILYVMVVRRTPEPRFETCRLQQRRPEIWLFLLCRLGRT